MGPSEHSQLTQSAWELPPTVTNREAIAGTGEVGVCIVRFAAFDYAESSYRHAQLILPSIPIFSEIAWRAAPGENLIREQFESRHFCYIAPEVPHAGSWKRETELLLLLVRPSFLQAEFGQIWPGVVVGELSAAVAKDRMVWWLLSVCQRLLRKRSPKNHALIEQIGGELVRCLLTSHFGGTGGVGKRVTKLSTAQLRKVTDYIEADWKRVAKLKDLAGLVGLSRVHFARVFKNTTGVSPARYQRICRMRKAQELLRSGDYRIEEVANNLGFLDASYFSRCFRQDFDMTPTHYIEEHCRRMS